MASTSARPKGVRPPCGGFFHAATRCSCSDRRPRISAAGSLRSPHRLPALSGWLRRHPETGPASRTGSRRLPPVRARGFRDPRRAATAGSLPPCVWPTSVPARRAALREPLRSPFGLPAGLPKLVLSLCSQTPPCVISHSFSPQFGVQENPRAREHLQIHWTYSLLKSTLTENVAVSPPCLLPFTIFVCESVFISFHLWLHLLPFFCLLLYFLCSVYRPWRPIALVQLSALGGRGGGVWGETLQIGPNRQQDGGVQARLHRCAIMLWAMHWGAAAMNFKLSSDYEPRGDQPEAIAELVRGVENGEKHQVLLGVTGSGKTFTMAKVIEHVNRPTVVLAHNKTLAAQLYHEFRGFFPHNAVEYFVSYYDYYQPEAYMPSSDTYIEKEATINDELDKLRMSATRSLLERRDVVIVASVSCIYGLGSPEAYHGMLLMLEKGASAAREALLRKLVEIQYERTEELRRGAFRVRGDMIEIYPPYEDYAYRVELWGDQIDALRQIDPPTGAVRSGADGLVRVPSYPKSHYVVPAEQKERAIGTILEELDWWKAEVEKQGKYVEAQRLSQRTLFDIEMIRTIGYCHGIENYSRHLSGRLPGEAPPTLLDYVPQDYLLFVDESHQTIPQLHGMYHGDRSRKQTLVDFGFRLPSALDNRPLTFEEFEHRINQ